MEEGELNMSFLNAYLQDHNLAALSPAAQKTLSQLEASLKDNVDNNATTSKFDDLIKESGDKIASIVERFSAYWKGINGWSLTTLVSTFRFVLNIGVEVGQLSSEMQKHIVTPTMTKEEGKQAQTQFGQELTFFIWKTVDPLKDKLNWIPFKSTIEKNLVYWLSGMALELAQDMLVSSTTQLSVNTGQTLKTM